MGLFLFCSGLSLGSFAAEIYSEKKKQRKKRTVEVHGEEFVLGEGWSTIVRFRKPRMEDVSLSIGGRITCEAYGVVGLKKYDLEASEAVLEAWEERDSYGSVRTDYKEAKGGKFTHETEWEDEKKWSYFD